MTFLLRRFCTTKKTGLFIPKATFTHKGEPFEAIRKEPCRQVFISQSNDIFTNLALEDWIYRHNDFNHRHLLLLWRNDPCVVIGRHQNPWTEANVPFLRENGINLARRNSGGGTVYHDQGNINCTFFTNKSDYHRRRNLNIICRAIRRMTCLDVAINDREDIVLNGAHKISGTAAKLGAKSAYHHCTVLVDVNECVLHDALHSKAHNVETRATQSVRVPVKNLCKVDPSIDVAELQAAVGWEFLRTNMEGVDIGREAANKYQRGFTMVRPDEGWFKGITKLRDDLQSPTWIYGKTPKFKVKMEFKIPDELMDGISTALEPEVKFEIEVHMGIIHDVMTQLPLGLLDPDFDLSEVLHGMAFGPGLPKAVDEALSGKMEEGKRVFLAECIRDMIGEFI